LANTNFSAIAAGATGTVFEALNSKTGQPVAIKVIHQYLLADAEARSRFDREARLLMELNHPNIVRLLAVERISQRLAVVMERIPGSDLARYIRASGPLSARAAISVLHQLSTGLLALHLEGIAHRDVSPSNIMLTPDGHVQLIDLGLAKRFLGQTTNAMGSPSSWVTPEGNALFGTPDYVAPETIRDCTSASLPADVYGLGAVAYFILTGSPPFPTGTPLEKLFQHLSATPSNLQMLRPDLLPRMADMLQRCLAKSPEHRPTSAELLQFYAEVEQK
jgi:eukaryotic-like serine/threonine-protein kinase